MSWLFKISSPMHHFPFPNESGYIKLPVAYIRFGHIPTDEQGRYKPSMNGLTGQREKGLSVYPAYYSQEKDMYVLPAGDEQFLSTQNSVMDRVALVVKGTEIGTGGDGEPVLDPKTVRVIKVVSPKKIVFEQDRWLAVDGTEIPEDKIPWFPGEKEATEKQQAQYLKQRQEQIDREKSERQEMINKIQQGIQNDPEYFKTNTQLLEAIKRLYPEVQVC